MRRLVTVRRHKLLAEHYRPLGIAAVRAAAAMMKGRPPRESTSTSRDCQGLLRAPGRLDEHQQVSAVAC